MELAISLYMPFCGSFLCKQSGKAEGEIKAPCSFHQYKISLSYWSDGTRKHGFMHVPPYPDKPKPNICPVSVAAPQLYTFSSNLFYRSIAALRLFNPTSPLPPSPHIPYPAVIKALQFVFSKMA
jgi:hypothetical protein